MSLRVLVVDDHDSLRDLFEICMSMEDDLEVVGSASDGLAAVDLAVQLQPDAIILDVHLPMLDGLEALPTLVEAVPGATIVVFSATSDRSVAAVALSRGAAQYLVKDDNDVADVIAAVRRRNVALSA